MNDSHVQAFLNAAETGSFSAAAARMFLPTQAVSRYVQNLEQELSATLFLRSRSGITLTETGLSYQKLFLHTLDALTQAKQACTEEQQRLRRSLRLGLSSWVDPCGPLGDGLLDFRRRQEGFRWTVAVYDNARLRREFAAGRLDAVILSGAQYTPVMEFESAALAPEDISLCVPEWVGADAVDPACWGLPFVECSSGNWGFLERNRLSKAELDCIGVEPRRIVLMPNTETMRSEMGLLSCVTLSDARFGILRRVPGIVHLSLRLDSSLVCVWNKRTESPLVRELVACMQRYFAGHVPDAP